MKLVWTVAARGDLREIYVYIAADNIQAGRKVIARLRERTQDLKHFPNLGRVGRVANTRELVIFEYPYIVAYTVDADTIMVLRVWPSKRKWPSKF